MDPLKELQQDYQCIGTRQQDNDNALAKHIELMMNAAKEEIISFNRANPVIEKTPPEEATVIAEEIEQEYEKVLEKGPFTTSSPEIISIPTFLLPDIALEFQNNPKVVSSSLTSLTKEAIKVFGITDTQTENHDTEETKDNGVKVVTSRKAKKRPSFETERRALIQAQRASLNITEKPRVTDEDAYLMSVDISDLGNIKDHLMNTLTDASYNEPNIRKIVSTRIADSLEETEHSSRRDDEIKEMIAELKAQDEEARKPIGVRIR